MQRVISDTKRPVKIWASDLEPEAEQQVRNVASLPFIHSHVAVMPDAHAGKGSTVGTVIATKGAIIPAAVGVDIGCGMQAMQTTLHIDRLKDLADIRHDIERSVPTGRYDNKEVTDQVQERLESLGNISPFAMQKIRDKIIDKSAQQLGSLGGGNHFIEICTDTVGMVWILLHSGSRGLGHKLASIHMEEAQGLMKKYFIDLPDPELAYLSQNTDEFKSYMQDLQFAQRYAKANRDEMMSRVLRVLQRRLPGWEPTFMVDCHHNYTNWENHGGQNIMVTRKGAVSAKEGEYGIIPGSMGAKSFIVRGKGNKESFCSCSHGAGRKMSRTKARAQFTLEDLRKQTEGVECPKDTNVLDEIPGAYKNIDEVMANQVDLVEPIFELKQVICVKGAT